MNRPRKYCNIRCQQDHAYSKMKESGKFGRESLRRFLKERDGGGCSVCNITEWNGKPIVLDLEHKDGNSANENLDNLCLLCPNCHSQTATYKGKNKGNGRHSRRLRYAEGKSY